MSTEALELYFTPRTLYFWSRDGKTLLPDERYMPKELDQGLRPTRVVEWLVAGPSAWLEPAVSRLSDKARNNQNVPYPKDQLEVALNAAAAEQWTPAVSGDLVLKLGQQLLWSLRPEVKTSLRLSIDGGRSEVFNKDQAFYAANAANRAPEGPEQEEAQPERFALFNGRIHRLRDSPGGGTQPLPRLLLSNGVNQGILQAAMARESGDELLTAVAMVVQDPRGYRLRLVSATGDGARAAQMTEPFTSMGRPVWLKAPLEEGLVVADKRLYRFTPTGGAVRVDVPNVAGEITDVSAAPDGRRIAVVASGRVYVFSVSRTDGKLLVLGETPRQLRITLRDVSAVDWSEETKVVVAGTGPDGKPAVWEVSIDGALEKSQFTDTGGKVGHLVAYPDDPVSASVSSTVMYSRDGAAFDLAGDKPGIEASDVMGAEGEVDLSRVTAPFFLLD